MQHEVISTKLSVERCLSHISQMHAFFHMCVYEKADIDDVTRRSFLNIVDAMHNELDLTSKALASIDLDEISIGR